MDNVDKMLRAPIGYIEGRSMGIFRRLFGKKRADNSSFEFVLGNDGHIRKLWLCDPTMANDTMLLKVIVTGEKDRFPKDVGLAAFINVSEGYFTVIPDTSERGGVYLDFGG